MKRNYLWDNPAACERTRELLRVNATRTSIAEILSAEFDNEVTRSQVCTWVSRHAREFLGQAAIMRYSAKDGPEPTHNVDPAKIVYRRNTLATVFLRKRTPIPEVTRERNVSLLLRAASKFDAKNQQCAQDLRYRAALWANSDTNFAAFDVTARSPLVAALDSRPMDRCIDRPATVVPGVSVLGMAGGM